MGRYENAAERQFRGLDKELEQMDKVQTIGSLYEDVFGYREYDKEKLQKEFSRLAEKKVCDLEFDELRLVHKYFQHSFSKCQMCGTYRKNVQEVPRRIVPALVGFGIFELWQRDSLDADPLDILEKVRPEYRYLCEYCISELATKTRKHKHEKRRLEMGHISLPRNSNLVLRLGLGSRRKVVHGRVYVVLHDVGVYKIGATRNPVSVRMSQHGYQPYQFVHAIETHDAFGLERYLHDQFGIVQVGRRELFRLDDDALTFIGNIKTVDDKPVTHIEEYT